MSASALCVSGSTAIGVALPLEIYPDNRLLLSNRQVWEGNEGQGGEDRPRSDFGGATANVCKRAQVGRQELGQCPRVRISLICSLSLGVQDLLDFAEQQSLLRKDFSMLLPWHSPLLMVPSPYVAVLFKRPMLVMSSVRDDHIPEADTTAIIHLS